MPRKINVSLEAEQEIAAGFEWYQAKDLGLGDRFLSAVKRSIKDAAANPEIYSIRFGSIRRIAVSKFPYGVLFSCDEDHLYVQSVFHESKNPQCLDRLRD